MRTAPITGRTGPRTIRVPTIWICAVGLAAMGIPVSAIGHAGTSDAQALHGEAAPAALPLTPLEAGAHYGQALGVALVCYGIRTTATAERLPAAYSGADRDAFQTQADKVLTAWRDASSCRTAGGPNQCRLIHEWSCRDALREIGPGGTKLPGLVEAKH